jgi:hypothetical protein
VAAGITKESVQGAAVVTRRFLVGVTPTELVEDPDEIVIDGSEGLDLSA